MPFWCPGQGRDSRNAGSGRSLLAWQHAAPSDSKLSASPPVVAGAALGLCAGRCMAGDPGQAVASVALPDLAGLGFADTAVCIQMAWQTLAELVADAVGRCLLCGRGDGLACTCLSGADPATGAGGSGLAGGRPDCLHAAEPGQRPALAFCGR
ncbi:hypothetical protein SDC9_116110 [bioreactor metagenome]|uniref:Uncharacterized protein n=1 Tax=bioreactor metagenome TaxID=1076179 RepID=A0A645BUP9_9ZZZZ